MLRGSPHRMPRVPANTATFRVRPRIIGHRGACGYRPEHTLASYRLAIAMGVDYIEPDLVATRDGVLVARHENEISGTTDVASRPEFAARRTRKSIDGSSVEGWFTEDFTFAELKTLRARERIPQLRPDNTRFDGRYEIPSFQEVIELARSASQRYGRSIGVAPETKHPSYFASIGLPLEPLLLQALEAHGYRDARAPVIVQSFEVGNLQALAQRTGVPLLQLMSEEGQPYDFTLAGDTRSYADLATPKGLADIARYAQMIGPSKDMIVPRDAQGRSGITTALVGDAHAAGLEVVVYTFRNENAFLPAELRSSSANDAGARRQFGDAGSEYTQFFSLGVDAVFSDHPDSAYAARAHFVEPT